MFAAPGFQTPLHGFDLQALKSVEKGKRFLRGDARQLAVLCVIDQQFGNNIVDATNLLFRFLLFRFARGFPFFL